MIAPVAAPTAVDADGAGRPRGRSTDCRRCAVAEHRLRVLLARGRVLLERVDTLLPVPGIAGTAGPLGIVAQPPSKAAAPTSTTVDLRFQ